MQRQNHEHTRKHKKKNLEFEAFTKSKILVEHKKKNHAKLINNSKKTNATLKGQKRKRNLNSLIFTKFWFVSSCIRYGKIDEAHKQLCEKKKSKVEKWKGQTHEVMCAFVVETYHWYWNSKCSNKVWSLNYNNVSKLKTQTTHLTHVTTRELEKTLDNNKKPHLFFSPLNLTKPYSMHIIIFGHHLSIITNGFRGQYPFKYDYDKNTYLGDFYWL